MAWPIAGFSINFNGMARSNHALVVPTAHAHHTVRLRCPHASYIHALFPTKRGMCIIIYDVPALKRSYLGPNLMDFDENGFAMTV